MTDHALRRLERAWRETGAPAAERAFRLAEVRAGVRTRASLRDLAVLRVSVSLVDRVALTNLVAEDPLLKRIPRRRTEYLVGPSRSYLSEAVERLRRTTLVRRVSQVAPFAVRRQLIGAGAASVQVRDPYGLPQASATLEWRAAACDSAEVELNCSLRLGRGHLESMRQGVMAAYGRVALPLWNGVCVHVETARPQFVGNKRWMFYEAGRMAMLKTFQQLEVRTAAWVRVPDGTERLLSRAFVQGLPWEFLEWRPVSAGAAPGRRG